MGDTNLAALARDIGMLRSLLVEAERDANAIDPRNQRYERLMYIRTKLATQLDAYFEASEIDRKERAKRCPIHGLGRANGCAECEARPETKPKPIRKA